MCARHAGPADLSQSMRRNPPWRPMLSCLLRSSLSDTAGELDLGGRRSRRSGLSMRTRAVSACPRNRALGAGSSCGRALAASGRLRGASDFRCARAPRPRLWRSTGEHGGLGHISFHPWCALGEAISRIALDELWPWRKETEGETICTCAEVTPVWSGDFVLPRNFELTAAVSWPHRAFYLTSHIIPAPTATSTRLHPHGSHRSLATAVRNTPTTYIDP